MNDLFGYLRKEATTAIWVFLAPLSGFWWALGKCYPLLKDWPDRA